MIKPKANTRSIPATHLGKGGEQKELRGRPRVRPLKGALVSVSSVIPIPNLICFQYNPESLKRRVKPNFYGGGERPEPARFSAAPEETIDLEIQIDATDYMDGGGLLAKVQGIRPQIASLEQLAYPSLVSLAQNQTLLSASTKGAVPIPSARTLLVFGATRVIPIRITGLDITEELFDSMLNPIRAKVGLSMEVITYSQVYKTEPLFAAHVLYQGTVDAAALAAKLQAAKELAASALEKMRGD